MRMIDALVKLANGEIKEGTLLKIVDEKYDAKQSAFEFSGGYFYHEEDFSLEGLYSFDFDFFNREVELIPPKEKKYLIKLNVKWLKYSFSYVNYVNSGTDQYVLIGNGKNLGSSDFGCYQTQFTEKELQSIRPVKEFLDEMQGKFELIEVEENEID